MTKHGEILMHLHAGATGCWKKQATAPREPHTPQERTKPAAGTEKSKAWGAALLRALPQPFQDLAARWGLAPSPGGRQQQSSPDSALASDWELDKSQNRQASWSSDSSEHRPLQLQLCLSSSSIHDAEMAAAGQLIPSSDHSSRESMKKSRSNFMDEESKAKRHALIGGEMQTID